MSEKKTGGGRKQLIIMLLIAAGSLGGSYALYYHTLSEGIWGTTNAGTFVDPPVSLESLALVDVEGAPLKEAGTWWLWVVRSEPCDAACADALHQLRQLHILLNKDADRVRRALVSPAPLPHGDLEARYPDLAYFTGRVGELEPGIYIVDPLGNLVLRYPLDAAGKPVLQDLQRLLKVSQIG